jgi:hypothetical protein
MVTEVSEKPTSFSPYEESFRDSGVRTTAGDSDVVACGLGSAPGALDSRFGVRS